MPAPWSSTANYPAGAFPWSGTPTKIKPAYTFFTPGTPPAAQEFNYLLNAFDLAIGSIAGAVQSMALANWNPPLSNLYPLGVGPFVPGAACWDAFHQVWIMVGQQENAGGTAEAPKLVITQDGGKTWLPGSFSALDVPAAALNYALASNPNNGTLCVVRTDATNLKVYVSRIAPLNTTTTTEQPFLESPSVVDNGVSAYFDGKFWFLGGSGFLTGSFTGFYANSAADGVGLWTDIHTSLPAGWASGSNVILEWLAAQSATDLVFAMCGTTAGSDTSRLLHQPAGGGAPSDITPAVLGGTAKEIRGIAFDSIDGLWGILVQDASNAYLYTSPDLATWTLVHTFAGYQAGGIAVVGSVWAAAVASANAADALDTIFFSTDVASDGASSVWTLADFQGASHSVSLDTIPSRIMLSSGRQVLYSTGFFAESAFGATARYSTALSLKVPPVAVVATGVSSGSATVGGGAELVMVNVDNTNTPVQLLPGQCASFDCSSGAVLAKAPASPTADLVIGGYHRAGTISLTNTVTMDGNGTQIEDPNHPDPNDSLHFASTVKITVQGAGALWQFDSKIGKWVIPR